MNRVLFISACVCILYTIASVVVYYVTDDGPRIIPIRRDHLEHDICINATAEGTIYERSQSSVRVPFDPYEIDTIVYMHIQKAGGSVFLEHLVTVQIPLERVTLSNDSGTLPTPDHNTQSMRLCRTSQTGGWKRIRHELCPRDWEHPNGDTWLISEKTIAWNCGIHPFYTDFKKCLQDQCTYNLHWREDNLKGKVMRLADHNRFHYVVMLRHPILRYVSEYLQVSRGSCWAREDKCGSNETHQGKLKPGELKCPEQFQCQKDLKEAFLTNLTLGRFLRCTESWSINRMTLMLADHELATCWDKKMYSREQRDQILYSRVQNLIYANFHTLE
jgi:hypothetical protein